MDVHRRYSRCKTHIIYKKQLQKSRSKIIKQIHKTNSQNIEVKK